jgi:hypothetical protein
MAFKLKYSSAFKSMYNKLDRDDKQEVDCVLEAIAECPEDGRNYDTEKIKYRKVMSVNRRRWPHGLRITYKIFKKEVTVACIDMGDHTTCGSAKGESVYADERKSWWRR